MKITEAQLSILKHFLCSFGISTLVNSGELLFEGFEKQQIIESEI